MDESSKSTKKNIPYIKLNSNYIFEELKETEYCDKIFCLPELLNISKDISEEQIIKFFYNILPESKEGDILKINYALSSGCKKNKNYSHECLNEIMNSKESSNLNLTKDFSLKLSYVLKEIFRRVKKYSNIKTYDEFLVNAKEFLYKGENIINIFMVEKKNDDFNIQINQSKTTDFEVANLSKSSKNLNKVTTKHKMVEFKFKDIKLENKSDFPAEMKCLIKKFATIKNLKISINNKNEKNKIEKYNLDLNNIQNTIFILYNSEWLFQNLLEIEIDLSNDNFIQNQYNIQSKNLKILEDRFKKNKKLSLYYFGLNKNIIFNPYQLSNFYSSSPKVKTDNFLYTHQNINEENILIADNLENEINSEDGESQEQNFENINYDNNYKYIFNIIVAYGFFISKLKNIRICNLIYPINFQDELIEELKEDKINFNKFNFLEFLVENKIHHFTVDFPSLDNQSFEKLLDFMNQNASLKIFRINFFQSEEYFKTEILYKILQINDKRFQELNQYEFKYEDDNRYIYDLQTNEDLDSYILRKLYKNFEKNISNFFYLLTIRANISELSLIINIPKIMNNNGSYITLIIKLILNILIFINSKKSNIGILSIQSESLIFDGRKCNYYKTFFDKLSLCENSGNKVKSLTLQCKFYYINNIYKIIPYGIEYLSLGSFDLETLKNFVNYITSIDFSEHSKLKKLQINLNNSIFEYKDCKEYLELLLSEHPKNLSQINIYSFISIKYIYLKELLLKSNYNIIENIFLLFSKQSLKDDGYKEKLKLEEYKQNIIIDRNFLDLFYVIRKKKNTNMILLLQNKLANKINKSFSNYNIFLNIEKFVENNDKKINIVEFK